MREFPLTRLDPRTYCPNNRERCDERRYVEEDISRIGVRQLKCKQRDDRLHRKRYSAAGDESRRETGRYAIFKEPPGKEHKHNHIGWNRGERCKRILSFHELGDHHENQNERGVDPVEDVYVHCCLLYTSPSPRDS